MTSARGQHFLQIPGPSPVPERVMRAMDRQVIDHRGPTFQKLGQEVLEGCQKVFKTSKPVIIYPSSGTGAWEAAIVNTLSPGDKVTHDAYGLGTVLSVEGSGDDPEAKIDFGSDYGVKHLVLRYAPIEKL